MTVDLNSLKHQQTPTELSCIICTITTVNHCQQQEIFDRALLNTWKRSGEESGSNKLQRKIRRWSPRYSSMKISGLWSAFSDKA